MSVHNTIVFSVSDNIAHLRLNRPHRLNAIDSVMLDELDAVMSQVQNDLDIRALVISGEGQSFCSGFDLKEDVEIQQTTSGADAWRKPLEHDLNVMMAFWTSRVPTIAAVHGYCLGGGCEIALACDITVAETNSMFGEPEVKFGSGIVFMILPWIVGPKRAKEIILLGRDRLSADEAQQFGMINRIVGENSALTEAMSIAEQLVLIDPYVLGMTKLAINRTFDAMGFRQAVSMALELDIQIEGYDAPEAVEFADRVRAKGLPSAVRWRDGRFSH